MKKHCGGMEGRNIHSELYRCPGCGAVVEIFSDEAGIRCQKCGMRVLKESASLYSDDAGINEKRSPAI